LGEKETRDKNRRDKRQEYKGECTGELWHSHGFLMNYPWLYYGFTMEEVRRRLGIT